MGHFGWILSLASLNFISVIYQCGLRRDLSLLEAGDMTEVGEKGLTLRYVPVPVHSTCVFDARYYLEWWTEGVDKFKVVDSVSHSS